MALIITLKPGGVAYIGDDISIMLDEKESHGVKLFIEASKDKNIARKEILTESAIEEIEYNIHENRQKRKGG